MAKAKRTAKRLKVYGAAMGFFDVVVAAANQAEALKAWGVRQNLFAEGAAHVVEDAVAVRAAQAQPGQVLRRPIGSDAPFAVEPQGVADIPTRKPRTTSKAADKPKTQRKAKPDAARDKRAAEAQAALGAAEAALDALEANWTRDEAEFARAKAALDEKRSAARAAYLDRRTKSRAALAAARRAARPSA